MLKIVKSSEMREIDGRAIRDFLISRETLMENAGGAVVRTMKRLYPDLSKKKILVVAGKGNNAGDGFVAARLLKESGCEVSVCLTTLNTCHSEREATRGVARGISFFHYEPPLFKKLLKSADIIIDALFGTGLRSTLGSPYLEIIRLINHSSKEIIAIDIPSGIDGDTGKKMGEAISATHTVTFGLPKLGFFLFPGQNYVGRLHIENIGFPLPLLSSRDPQPLVMSSREPQARGIPAYLSEPKDFIGKLPKRPKAMHKGEAGHLLIVAGSRGKIGAAVMTTQAAFRSGAGLITLLTDRKYLKAVFPKTKEAFIDEFPKNEADFKNILKGKDAVAIGPGIGFSAAAKKLVQWTIRFSPSPIVLDADALTIVSRHSEWLKKAKSPVILTPHPGEMARLIRKTTRFVQENRLTVAGSFAKKYGVFVVLKGAATVIAKPNGDLVINSTGNPAMATAGMGDVLTGMIASFIGQGGGQGGQGMAVEDAVSSAVFLHGKLADEWVEARHATRGLTASDLIEALPAGVEKLFFSDVSFS